MIGILVSYKIAFKVIMEFIKHKRHFEKPIFWGLLWSFVGIEELMREDRKRLFLCFMLLFVN